MLLFPTGEAMTRASGFKAAGLVVLVAAAAMVPLYGDPRQTPVTHTEWARMLLRAMDMEDAVRSSTQASQVFSEPFDTPRSCSASCHHDLRYVMKPIPSLLRTLPRPHKQNL